MGECIITRAAGEAEAALPLSPGYHTIGITLRDYNGKAVVNFPLVCKDGTQNYNYKTNEKGQTIFMVNSGSANIYLNNNIYGYQMLDFNSVWYNVDAPVGLSTRVNINMNRGSSFHEFTASKTFGFLYSHECELILVGGGGGGGVYYSRDGDYGNGGGGGAGYLSQYNNQILIANNKYSFIVGSGGAGNSTRNLTPGSGAIGKTGGTSYISETEYAANGGGGGYYSDSWMYEGGVGGLGNGGGYKAGANSTVNQPGDSIVDFAGGGGGSPGFPNAGKPYGGNNGGYSGSRGGGGGGSQSYDQSTASSGSGGSGLMRINIIY